jgi:predicted DNA-binding protein YlxM (UPF0122 family)
LELYVNFLKRSLVRGKLDFSEMTEEEEIAKGIVYQALQKTEITPAQLESYLAEILEYKEQKDLLLD